MYSTKKLLFIVCALLILGNFSAPIWAQTGGLPALPPPRAKAYKISGGDKLRIAIVQEAELDSILRVDAKGCVNLKYVGELKIQGLSISEAEKTVEAAYRDGRFLRNPQVTINMEEYQVREVSITGEVKAPGRIPLPVETVSTVLWLITKAGGFTDTAKGTEVKVSRLGPDGRIAKVFVVDVESIIKGKAKKGKLEEDDTLELEPNDVVFVPIRFI